MKPQISRLFSIFLFVSALSLLSCGTSREGTRTDEDIHNTGYGKETKRSSIASISTVERDKSMNDANISVLDMLRRAPGVSIGPGNSITIRGASSIYMSTEPLFVVDGVAVGSSYQAVSSMNPQDIRQISVLKGPSASIYGSRGANGVIVIETKSGRN
jgi:TonB-dependent SusC/RagA subfamily outer membrane receptor